MSVPPEAVLNHLRHRGPMRGPALMAELQISHPTLSRRIRALGNQVLVIGRARATRYAARRQLPHVDAPVSVYWMEATPTRLGRLHPVHPDGFWFEGLQSDVDSAYFDDLPYFLHDLRPAGFLGRQVGRRHPELQLPPDVRQWSAENVLRWLTRFGDDLLGALIVGDEAYRRFLQRSLDPPADVAVADRSRIFVQLATDLLAQGTVGSSAGGEHPKFLTSVQGIGPVLVKFSPPRDSAGGWRAADLLVAESVAATVLKEHGIDAVESEIVEVERRIFLQVKRFDRTGGASRRGMISLEALDAQFVGSSLTRWPEGTRPLAEQGRLRPEDDRTARWLCCFGDFIANTDMHFANLSFYTQGLRPVSIAPAYDMLPMAYQPIRGEVVPRSFDPALPEISDADVAPAAFRAALDFWNQVALDARISESFRQIGRENREILGALQRAISLLPT